MRLICPNCGAQYEVADDVIPQDGRDVQCSNCAHTWFENWGASEVEDDAVEDIVHPSAPSDDTADDDGDDDDDDNAQWGAEDYAAQATPPKPTPTPTARQELAPAIADILREEAAREASARRVEADAMETQPDLGLDSADAAPDQRTIQAQERMAQRKGEPEPVVAASRAAIAAASRGDLLPDIEEINSSLRSDSERGLTFPDELPEPKVRKHGARGGFIFVILILALLTALYIFAPKIRTMVPAVDGPLTTYVDTVDKGRLWLDAQLRRALDAMNGDENAAMEPMDDAVASEADQSTAPTVSTQAPELAPVTE